MALERTRRMLPFYFGSINETQRLDMERELLTDPEALLDYLDLKRTIEGAVEVPPTPSPWLWNKLRAQVPSRKKMITFSLGFAAAMAALFVLFVMTRPKALVQESSDGILFDGSNEPRGRSSVL